MSNVLRHLFGGGKSTKPPSKHIHDLDHIDTVRAPLPDDHHTIFMILACQCGYAEPFPASNFDLCAADTKAAIVDRFQRSGYTLIASTGARP